MERIMGRTITISTPVFAAIWRMRKDGEETEDAILARLLDATSNAEQVASSDVVGNTDGGVFDGRNGVRFPEGFKAFRHYRGRYYEAVVRDGKWVRRDTGGTYPSLNKLSTSITAGLENIWNGSWKFRAEDGSIHPLDVLRRIL